MVNVPVTQWHSQLVNGELTHVNKFVILDPFDKCLMGTGGSPTPMEEMEGLSVVWLNLSTAETVGL